jgi:hypothetical protein
MPSPSIHPLVKQLQGELMPVLREVIPTVVDCSPSARVSEFAIPVGSSTTYQGFHFGLSCLLSGVPESAPDEVALVISACHLDRQPRLNAEVVWGNPSGHVEAELSSASSSDNWPLATSEWVGQLRLKLPHLVAVLRTAAQRGHP